MKKPISSRRKLMLAGLGGLAAQFIASGAAAQDPARVMPRAYRVVFENDRVLHVELKAPDKSKG